MKNVVMITIVLMDAHAVQRHPSGSPTIAGEAIEATVILATPHDGGWLLDSWHRPAPDGQDGRSMELGDTAALAASVGAALEAIASRADTEAPPGIRGVTAAEYLANRQILDDDEDEDDEE